MRNAKREAKWNKTGFSATHATHGFTLDALVFLPTFYPTCPQLSAYCSVVTYVQQKKTTVETSRKVIEDTIADSLPIIMEKLLGKRLMV